MRHSGPATRQPQPPTGDGQTPGFATDIGGRRPDGQPSITDAGGSAGAAPIGPAPAHPEHLAALLEQITAAIRANADAARRASELADEARELAERSGRSDASLTRRMEGLQLASQRIGEIVGVIDGISLQTQLLALDAAVQAAGAGEHGRGLAAVAGEMRSLAARARDSAGEIRALIDASAAQVAARAALVADSSRTVSRMLQAWRS